MIIPRHDEHAALRGRTIGVAMFQRIARPVDAGALAVPHRKDAFDLRLRVEMRLLRTQNGGGAQILVHRRQKADAGLVQPVPDAPQFLIQPTERRAAIAGDEAGGIHPRRPVAASLIQHDPRQRLRAGHEDRPRGGGVAVVQLVAGEIGRGFGHGVLLFPA